MANPQKENGYTPIANEIMEAVAQLQINATQFRILMVVWRYTYGFSRKEHRLSASFIATATGIHKKQVSRELAELLKRNILTEVVKPDFNVTRVIAFNKLYTSWQSTKTLPVNETVDQTGNGLVDPTGSENVDQDKQVFKTNIKAIVTRPSATPYEKIKELYNTTCLSLPKMQTMTDKRKKAMRVRWKVYEDIEIFKKVFTKAENSEFLSGRSGKWTGCNFDWLLNEANMVKVLEGNYDEKKQVEPQKREPEYDYIEDEEKGIVVRVPRKGMN